MGIGYTIVLVLISLIRELLGGGTLFAGTALKIEVIPEAYRIGIFNSAPGGFLVFGILAALVQAWKQSQKNKADAAEIAALKKAELSETKEAPNA